MRPFVHMFAMSPALELPEHRHAMLMPLRASRPPAIRKQTPADFRKRAHDLDNLAPNTAVRARGASFYLFPLPDQPIVSPEY